MLVKAIFRCNFCGKTPQEDPQKLWTLVRFSNTAGTPKTVTNNDLFDLQWTDDPIHNLKGSHICLSCASSLMDKMNPPQANKPAGIEER